METLKFVFVILMVCICSSHAYTFYVGGKDGWVINPYKSYNHWAGRNRFQVNDKIFFKYKEGSDLVLVVSKDDFYKCNKANPIQTLKDGNSKFKFEASGPFFFISGHDDKCENGQKLVIVVMGVKRKAHMAPPVITSPLSPSPSPVSLMPEPTDNRSVFQAPAPAPSLAPPLVGGGSMVLLMGLSSAVLCRFIGLI